MLLIWGGMLCAEKVVQVPESGSRCKRGRKSDQGARFGLMQELGEPQKFMTSFLEVDIFILQYVAKEKCMLQCTKS